MQGIHKMAYEGWQHAHSTPRVSRALLHHWILSPLHPRRFFDALLHAACVSLKDTISCVLVLSSASVSISIWCSTSSLPSFVLHRYQHVLRSSLQSSCATCRQTCCHYLLLLPCPAQQHSFDSYFSVFRSWYGLCLPCLPDPQQSHPHKCFAVHSSSPDH